MCFKVKMEHLFKNDKSFLVAMAALTSANTGISVSYRAQNVCHRHYKPSFGILLEVVAALLFDFDITV